MIRTIRESDDAESARGALMNGFDLTQVQAQAILDMQLRRLAALERQRILDEFEELRQRIEYLEDLLGDPGKILTVVKDETVKLKEDFGDERRSELSDQEAREFTNEDLIPHQNVVVSVSNRNYAKRLTIDAYRVQRRGGQGVKGMVTREQDVVDHLLIRGYARPSALLHQPGACASHQVLPRALKNRRAPRRGRRWSTSFPCRTTSG